MASNSKQLAINMIASVVSFVASYAISFLLTPYIIKTLGTAAYGFVGLGTQILGYTTIITIALNSMAGRYVSIEYHKGNFDRANKYFSSVFYSNCVISVFLFIVSCCLVIYLDLIINIPDILILDVKLLFALLSFNSIIGLITNVYGVSCFIKNRLDYSNIRSIVGNILRAVLLTFLFALLLPKLWYFGITGFVTTIYIAVTNVMFSNKFTPELQVNKIYFDINCVIELIKSGIWNLITKLSNILESGLNLLIANLFVGAELAGTYAVCTTVPMMINSICSMMSANFAPTWTHFYAKGDIHNLKNEIFKSIRIMGFLSSIPITVFVVLGKSFYQLWVPSEDATLLYWLSIASSIVMVVAMPLEPLWNIFTITDNVKKSSINLLEWSIAMFSSMLLGMYIVDDVIVRLFIIAAVKSLLGTIRTLSFLPIYGAKCLGFDIHIFYKPVIRNIICMVLIVIFSWFITYYFTKTWLDLFVGAFITSSIGLICNWFLSLNDEDRLYIKSKVIKK